jgi:hypothetical protein
MATTFRRCAYFSTFQNNKLIWNSTYHYFLVRSSKSYKKKISLSSNYPNRFHSIWIYLASDIHILPKTPIWDRIFGLVTNPNFHRVYIQNCSEQRVEIFTQCSSFYNLFSKLILDLETFQKKIVSKISRSLVLSSQTLELSCSNTKCYELNNPRE